jgi:hypothetical protein
MLLLLVNLTERGLVNVLEDLKPKTRLRTCRMRELLHSLSDTDRQILKDAIQSPDWTSNALLRALRDKGIEISYTSVRRHEVRHCSCGESEYA